MAALAQRQLPKLLSDLLPNPHDTNTPEPTRSAGLTPTESITSTNSISSSSSVTSLSEASPAAVSRTSESSSLAVSSTVTTSSSPSSSPTPLVTPPPPPPASTETTSADDSTFLLTVTPSSSPSPSIQAAPANSANGFLQNKTLSGVVFGIVGVVALILIVTIATIALRKSRRKRLHDEAISFDPAFFGGSQLDRESVEKRRFSLLSSNNGHDAPAVPAATAPVYTRQDPYGYSTSESQHTLVGHTQPPWYGGSSYGVVHTSQRDVHPVWASSNSSVPPPTSPDRTQSPQSVTYLQAGNLKVANA